jgi:hypothetical protein
VAAFIIGIIVVVLAIGAVLAFRTYDHVKGPLQNAQNTLSSLAHNTSGLSSVQGRALTATRLAEASGEISSAQRQIDTSLGLKVLGIFPGLGTQRSGLVQLVADLRATTSSALSLLHSMNTLAANSHGTDISLPDLKALGSVFTSTRAQLASDNRPISGLWGPLGTYRKKFDREDARAVHLLSQGADATRYSLEFLGADGPQTYLVMGENNAEMRDEGATLSYSLLHTLNGAITEQTGGTVNNIELASPAPVSVPAGTQAEFGQLGPTETWQSTNATADFAFSGRDMQAMFASATGTHVDGVIGIDVVGLQALLGLTGPVSVPGIPERITSSNAANVLLDQLYENLPPGSSQGPRREELAAVASAAFHQLEVRKVDVVALARTLATAVGGRHLQLWDENAQNERTITEVGASGEIDTDDPTRTFHVAVENATATKLDYFVDVAISDTVVITPKGSADVYSTVKLTNHAPAGQAPSYQLGPDGINSDVPGEYIGRVFLWGPRGSHQSGSVHESGLLLAPETDLVVMPGKSVTTEFETVIPHAIQQDGLRLVFVPQPRLTPESLKVHIVASGTQSTVSAVLTKTTALSWQFERS